MSALGGRVAIAWATNVRQELAHVRRHFCGTARRSALVQGRHHLRAARQDVHDSNGDGIGDFRGLIEKLDYLQELGVTAIWLLPFYPSPLRDDGYDIADYYDVNPNYGTLDDFKAFLAAAHERGLQVITELVINHTSDQNPWFQKSRRAAPGSPERELYVWSDTPEKYKEARIIFKDFETSNWSWDPVAKAYYWHRFYSHQPDLNFDNPAVHERVEKVLDFWLEHGRRRLAARRRSLPLRARRNELRKSSARRTNTW